MFDHNKFIEFCINNNNNLILFTNTYNTNENIKKLDNLFTFIKDNYKNTKLLNNYKKLEIWFKKEQKNTVFLKNTRMTCIEYL